MYPSYTLNGISFIMGGKIVRHFVMSSQILARLPTLTTALSPFLKSGTMTDSIHVSIHSSLCQIFVIETCNSSIICLVLCLKYSITIVFLPGLLPFFNLVINALISSFVCSGISSGFLSFYVFYLLSCVQNIPNTLSLTPTSLPILVGTE